MSAAAVHGHEPEHHVPWESSPQWPTLPAALADAAARGPDTVAVIDGDIRLTYLDYSERSLAVARALIAAGVGPGDRVAVWLQNRAEWPVICLGIWRAGAIIVPINTRLKGLEAADMLERTRAKVLLALPSLVGIDYLTLLHEACGPPVEAGVGDGDGADDPRPFRDLPDLRLAVYLDDGPGTEGCVPYADFLATASHTDPATVAEREAALTPDDPAELLFTSGTTGKPKAVSLGHQQLLRSYWDWSGIVELDEHDRFLLTSPYAHGPGINGNIVASLIRRFASVVVDVFDAPTVLDLVLREGVTAMLGPANLYARLMAAAEARGLGKDETPRLRLAILGMAGIPPELIARLRDEWSVGRICNAYGAIESTVVSMTRRDDPPSVVERSTGRALPGVELRVVDDANVDVAPGQPGELLIRSFAVMQGYWGAPDATAEAVEPDGWFHSGDIVTRDEAGNVTIVDRLKEVFMVNGFSVYPAEVEGLLLHHPALAHSAVVAVPDEGSGEAGVAYVVPRTGMTVDPAEVVTWARGAMAGYKAPRHVVVLDELPVAATGKTDRVGLRQRWLDDNDHDSR
ncbi:MAG TPA: AMP-binding protein [Acidimicrobiales bacterium]|nr:AMP-binding protein [Acidimicrobiales bacterium]